MAINHKDLFVISVKIKTIYIIFVQSQRRYQNIMIKAVSI